MKPTYLITLITHRISHLNRAKKVLWLKIVEENQKPELNTMLVQALVREMSEMEKELGELTKELSRIERRKD